MNGTSRGRRRARGARVTLADVAIAAAVSTASASRALTRPEAVSEQVRIRVSVAADRLGYVANSAARALARRGSGWVGVIVGDLEPGVAPALAALEKRLVAAGWALVLGGGGEAATTIESVQTLIDRGVEALVFLGAATPAGLAELRAIRHLPCISVDRGDESGVVGGTGLDLFRGGRLIAEHLWRLGHRRLATVAGKASPMGALLAEALRAECAGGAFELEALRLNEIDASDGEWLSTELLMPNAPTALICSSDAVALAMMHVCLRMKIDVPGRMSIVGFGDSSLARCVSPRLSSLRIPAIAAGIAAAEYLLARFAGRPPDLDACSAKLVLRGSTGPPFQIS